MHLKVLFILLLLNTPSFSQIIKDLEDPESKKLSANEKIQLERANHYFQNQDFLYALPYFDSLYYESKCQYFGYLLGCCMTFNPNYSETSENLILAADSIRHKLPDYNYFLGKAYESNEKYPNAIAQFESYLKMDLTDTLSAIIHLQIEICKNAAAQKQKSALAILTNLGPSINSEAAEYCPVLPSDERFIVFTYRGKKSQGGKQKFPGHPDPEGTYFEDIFISYRNFSTGGWDPPVPIASLNTNGHDAVMCISHDGSTMYIFRNLSQGRGDIYTSRLKGENWTSPIKMKGVNTNFWEGSVCLSPDEKLLYFSSERPDGHGGRDIWIAQRMDDGSYGNVKNAGSNINTPMDEDAPFLTANGRTIFFSSKGHNSIGGYDIFKCEFKDAKWTTPQNIGKPVNTNSDDIYFWVSPNESKAYYSSERKGGFGSQDIYISEPGNFGKPSPLVMVSGKVMLNDKPTIASITVRSLLLKKDFSGTFSSLNGSGDYLVNLPAGNEYELLFKCDNTTLSKKISTAGIDTFSVLRTDAFLYTPNYLSDLKAKLDSTQLQPDNLNDLKMTYTQFLEKFGTISFDSVHFRVQIAAYHFTENFNYRKIIGLPPVLRQVYADGITRYTMGDFITLNEAEKYCRKAKGAGNNDAFVIAISKQKRIRFYQIFHD